ncbi:6-carboxytetrahydropterin synthase QueD [Desulfotomaculum copahuensis]|uniref:6-carboxy-5,6,7,8-tetrahydropterin synthase n=1 Tax=Desulfotomaculum copahuensis TaxID=1838280 RepID=A0A1B7LE21_9FIRM|nr:6-carboxytetrahydropterin synthase QueD [Desulfotomaculum copahuensis]OAT81347.1 6-carboxytetrahydropterin synthase QueD [Desulfotomaculum copahuensis]
MYQLSVTKRFAAAHRLSNYQGQCANLHGHTWQLEVTVKGEKLDANGMLLDFKALKEMVGRVIKELDHQYLNELPSFNRINPTAENLARYISGRLRVLLAPELQLALVRVWESPDAWAGYTEDEQA